MLCLKLFNRFLKFVHWLDRMLKVTHLVWNAVKCTLSLQSANQNDEDVEEAKHTTSEVCVHPVLVTVL